MQQHLQSPFCTAPQALDSLGTDSVGDAPVPAKPDKLAGVGVEERACAHLVDLPLDGRSLTPNYRPAMK